MQKGRYFPALRLPEIQSLLDGADHIDVKTVTGLVDLRTFIAGFLNYQPLWLLSFYAVRRVFVHLLSMRQAGLGLGRFLTPETVPMQVGRSAGFFTVRMAKEGHYWFADHSDTHLKATIGVV